MRYLSQIGGRVFCGHFRYLVRLELGAYKAHMIRHSSLLAAVALVFVAAPAQAQSQPVTGTIVRPRLAVVPQAPPPKPTTKTPELHPKSPPPKVNVSEKSEKLQVGAETYDFVRRVHEIAGQRGLDASTTEWWELRDASGKVIHREDYGAPKLSDGIPDFKETVDVSAHIFKADGGSGILVEGLNLPSAPNSGTWVQVFAHQWGPKPLPLAAFGPPISTDGAFTELGIDHRRDPGPQPPGITAISMHDVLKFRIWTGNFNIEYPVLINWITGRVEPAMHCFRMMLKGKIERCSYPIQVEPQRETKEPTFVRLFQEPEEGFGAPKHVVIQPDSTIEYLAAEVPVTWHADAKNIFISAEGPSGSDTWLRVRIDGQEGWIHTEEDFQAVGLPQAG